MSQDNPVAINSARREARFDVELVAVTKRYGATLAVDDI